MDEGTERVERPGLRQLPCRSELIIEYETLRHTPPFLDLYQPPNARHKLGQYMLAEHGAIMAECQQI